MFYNYWDVLLLAAILAEAVSNGCQDNIDHHKSMMALRDIWHLAKYCDRGALIAVGFFCSKVDWDWLKILMLLPVMYFAKMVWDFFYTNYVNFWFRLDESVEISTGWKWLDELLGFDK